MDFLLTQQSLREEVVFSGVVIDFFRHRNRTRRTEQQFRMSQQARRSCLMSRNNVWKQQVNQKGL